MHGSLHCSKKCQVLYCSHIVWTPSFLLKSTNIGTFIKGVLDAICSIFPRKHVYHCSSHIQVVKLSKTSHGGPCLFKGHSDTVACISMVHMCYVPKMNAGWNDFLPNIFANNVQRFSHSTWTLEWISQIARVYGWCTVWFSKNMSASVGHILSELLSHPVGYAWFKMFHFPRRTSKCSTAPHILCELSFFLREKQPSGDVSHRCLLVIYYLS